MQCYSVVLTYREIETPRDILEVMNRIGTKSYNNDRIFGDKKSGIFLKQ